MKALGSALRAHLTEAQAAEFIRTCPACGTVFNVLAGHGINVCAAVLNQQHRGRRAA